MVSRRFELLANRRAEQTIAIVFQIRVGLVKSKGPFQPPDSAKNITLVLQMFSTFPDLSARLTVPISFTACMKRKIIN